MSEERAKQTKILLLVTLLAILVVASGLLTLYFEENKKTSPPIRVACVGDSITELAAYPRDLQKMLGESYDVENFGVVGATVLLNTDKPYLNQTSFQETLYFKPNIIIIMLGTNDARINVYSSSENFETNYELLVGEFQNLKSEPEIWLVLPPPIFHNTLNLVSSNLANGIIPHIQHVAKELGLQTIDVYSSLYPHPDYFDDGVHPNNDGSKLIAKTVFVAIDSLNTPT